MSKMKRDEWGYASYCVYVFCTLFKKTIAFGLQTNYLPQLNYIIYITVHFRVLGVAQRRVLCGTRTI